MSRVLLTGAAGALGSHMRQWLRANNRAYVATDIRPSDDGEDIVLVDVSDAQAVASLMAHDISAVVHLGGQAKEAGWDAILNSNIVGTYNIFEAARRAKVSRIIYASSYHVVGMYPTDDTPLGVDAPARPDTLYGVSKVFGETLGRFYFDKFGIQCLAIRICTAGFPKGPREARLWCNRDDLAALIARGLDVDRLDYRVVFGISANDNAFYINPPDPAFGWAPEHSSSELDLPFIGEPLDPYDPTNELQGGVFSTWGHFDDKD